LYICTLKKHLQVAHKNENDSIMKEFNDEKNFINIYNKLLNDPGKFPFVVVKNRVIVQTPHENSTDNTNSDSPVQRPEGNVSKLNDEMQEYFNMVNMSNYYNLLQSKMLANEIMKTNLQNRQHPLMSFVSPQFMPQSPYSNQGRSYMNMMAFLYLKNLQGQQTGKPF